MVKLVVADIDGCCISVQKRLKYWLACDIKTFAELWHTDEPIPQGIAVYQKFLEDSDYKVLFVTARWEQWRSHTLRTLRYHVWPDIQNEQLLMRPDNMPPELGDMPGDFKPALLEAHGYNVSDVFIAFDDSKSVIDGWRKRGIVAYQTMGDHHK